MGRGTAIVGRFAAAGALVAALVLVLAGPAPAAAACWQRLTLDWAADGSIDQTYPIACYQQAIDNQRADVGMYTSFEDDVRRAQQRAIAGGHTTEDPGPAPDVPATGGDGGVPVPLLVLGGVAILLVAVGGVGLVRRRQRPDEPGTP